MSTREYQKIYDEALGLLAERPYVMLSFLGERVKAYTPKEVGLLKIIEQSERLELLRDQNPSKPERVAVCKKNDFEAKKAFEKKYNETTYSPTDFLRSVLCAFTQNINDEQSVFIESYFPYKFNVLSEQYEQVGKIKIPTTFLLPKNGDFMSLSSEEFDKLVSNIKNWCSENDVKFESFLLTHKKMSTAREEKAQNKQQILKNFLEAQRPEIKNKIVLPVEFISFFFQNE